MKKKVFLPFNPNDLRGSTELLFSEFHVHLEGIIQKPNIIRQIYDSENGGLLFSLVNESKKIEVDLEVVRKEVSILITFFNNSDFVKNSPLITSPEGLSNYFQKMEDFLKN